MKNPKIATKIDKFNSNNVNKLFKLIYNGIIKIFLKKFMSLETDYMKE